ncbi:MAG: hypothetical protein Q4C52_02545 [Eubacteriales bacterium]|nr:hypothetical protein [Eubacteriales bacterium]
MKRAILSLLILIMLCTGCSGQTESTETDQEEASVSPYAKKVLEAMMTCPNKELCDLEAMSGTVIGLGVDESEDEEAEQAASEAAAEVQEEIDENWRKLVGDCFAEEYFEKFLRSFATEWLSESEVTGEQIAIESMDLEEKGEVTELVCVTLDKGENKEQVSVLFTYDSEGKIQKMEIKELSE